MELDVAALSVAYEARVRALLDGELPHALELRDRLAPGQWTLEWHLPWWVGRAFGVGEGTCRELALANVLGLVALRLRDDAADGELSGVDPQVAADHANRLFDSAMATYRAHLGADSPFWPELDRLLRAAQPGAPLKASAFGVCLLAGRSDAYPALAGCLDHALAALVLYDHAADWEADLACGRPNAFVRHVGVRTREEMLAALMARDGVSHYLARIEAELAAAVDAAEALAVGPLAEHLRALSARMRSDVLALGAHYGSLGDRAAGLFR